MDEHTDLHDATRSTPASPDGAGVPRGPRSQVSANRLAPVVLSILLVAAGLGTQYARQSVRIARFHQHVINAAEVYEMPPVPVIKVLALGYQTLAADLLFLRAHHYMLGHLVTDRRYQYLRRYFDTIVAVDPYLRAVYRWGALMAKMGQTITKRSVEEAIGYLERGLEYFPDDWEMYLDIGFNHWYEWRPEFGDREKHKRIGIEYFTIAASLPGSGVDPNLIASLYQQHDEADLALAYAYSLYMDASKEQRKKLQERIAVLASKAAAEALAKRDEEWKRDFPFLPRRLFEFVGPRVQRKVPASWQDFEFGHDQVLDAVVAHHDGDAAPALEERQ